MLYRCLTLVTLLTLTACGDTVEPSGDVPAYDPEPVATTPTHYTDADPAPLYTERTPTATPTPASPEPMYDAEPTPVKPVTPTPADPTPPEPTPVTPVTPTPTPVVTPAPAAPPTSCRLASGVVLTCAKQHAYGYALYWSVGLATHNCNVSASEVVQCKRGDSCGATHSDGTGTETGVCQ